MAVLTELEDNRFRDWMESLWGIRVSDICRDAGIQGSPERSLSRAVVEDASGSFFLMEKFAREKFRHRSRVARTLARLNRQGLSRALAPETARTGEHLPFFGKDCYQVTRYVDSTALGRPQWLSCPEIGQEMAGFLIEMRRASKGIQKIISYPAFSIRTYIYRLFQDMETHHPDFVDRYLPVLSFLEMGFMGAHDSLTQGFCHGDFHPLNVIWDHYRIRAVIDWEFTGMKPDCYDAANLVGCAGIEHPEGLAMPMVTTFLSRIQEEGIMGAQSRKWFPEYVLALRFAWLSEWLRTQDEQMLETEAVFMNILIDHMEELRDIWQNI